MSDSMTPPIEVEGSQRNTILRNLLSHLREKERARIQQLRKARAGDPRGDPHDSLDDARADENLEVHADLVARAEDRLAEIHRALERLDANIYGICAKCKREIDLARIRAVPFTELCIDCERQLDARRAGRRGEIGGTAGDEFMAHWTAPEGIVERLGTEEPLEVPDENPSELAGETIISAPAATTKRVRQRRVSQSRVRRNPRKRSR